MLRDTGPESSTGVGRPSRDDRAGVYGRPALTKNKAELTPVAQRG